MWDGGGGGAGWGKKEGGEGGWALFRGVRGFVAGVLVFVYWELAFCNPGRNLRGESLKKETERNKHSLLGAATESQEGK